MIVSIQAMSDIGMIRKNNEDMVMVDDNFIRDAAFESGSLAAGIPHLIAVSDGMGGHNAGEMASEFVLRRMLNDLPQLDFSSDEALQSALDTNIRKIHEDLNRLGDTHPDMAGMGCTFTGIYCSDNRLYLVHIGDSRLYSLRGQYISQISKDHTVGKFLKMQGQDANKLVNCFGGAAKDIFFDFENLGKRMEEGDMLMLCSDGLSGELSEDELELALGNDPRPAYLIELAKQKGGKDNISCIIIKT